MIKGGDERFLLRLIWNGALPLWEGTKAEDGRRISGT